MSTLAAQVLSRTEGLEWPYTDTDIAWIIESARSLAASVMSQDETKGQK
jgi:hypothetical protein